MADEPSGRMLVEQGVAVEADQVLIARRERRHPESHRFALVFRKVNDSKPRFFGGERFQPLAGVIRRRIVDSDDLEIRIVLIEQRADRRIGVLAFVVAGNDERYRGRRIQWRRIVRTAMIGLFAIEEIVDRSRCPDVGHDHRVVKREVEHAEDEGVEIHRDTLG